jgi:hypothetical protein
MIKIPAFIDSHLHFLGMGYVAYLYDLKGFGSIEALIKTIKNKPSSSQIIGRGWNQEHFKEQRMLNKHDLNQISQTIPVVMIRTCGHVLVVNDKMLEMAKIDASTVYHGTGAIDFELGIFSEDAIHLIYEAYPTPTKEDLIKYLVKANQICLANGITHVASDDFQIFPIPFEDIIDLFNECYEKDLIQVRVVEQANMRTLAMLQRFIAKGYVNKNFGKWRMGPLKLLADGSLGGRTALLKEPYSDDSTNRGIQTYANNDLYDMVALAEQHGMDVVIHAIGDHAIDLATDAIIHALEKSKRVDHCHAIIHAQLATVAQIKRMKAYNIGAIIQPIFLNSDIEMVVQRIGERSKEAYLFKSMDTLGLPVGFSTDTPIENVNPFENIYCAVSRKSIDHPTLDSYLPQEGYTVEAALSCYQERNLRYVYLDTLHDEIILDKDPRLCSVEELKNIKVLKTFIDGKMVFQETQWND